MRTIDWCSRSPKIKTDRPFTQLRRAIVSFGHAVKDNVVGCVGVEAAQDAQLGFGFVAPSEAGDDQGLGIRETMDNAPGAQLIVISRHDKVGRSR
jgi:delta-aminolevulinic acid dehydratase/porphobilinogen synthase